MLLNNPCFTAIPDVNAICEEYFGKLKLNYFGHITVYPEGRFHFLASDYDWPQYGFAEEQIPPGGFTVYDKIENSIKFPQKESGEDIGWSQDVMKISIERFNVQNLMVIFRKYADHYQGFFFDLHDEKAQEKYINNFDFFENFIFYYKDRAQKHLKIASQHQLIVNIKYLSERINNSSSTDNSMQCSDIKLQNQLQPKQYFLTHGGKDYSISVREYQCLALISHGKKIKDAANVLNISSRTIDTHIISLKRKLNINSLTKAVEIYWSNRIRSLP